MAAFRHAGLAPERPNWRKADFNGSAESKFPNDLSAHHIHAGCAIPVQNWALLSEVVAEVAITPAECLAGSANAHLLFFNYDLINQQSHIGLAQSRICLVAISRGASHRIDDFRGDGAPARLQLPLQCLDVRGERRNSTPVMGKPLCKVSFAWRGQALLDQFVEPIESSRAVGRLAARGGGFLPSPAV